MCPFEDNRVKGHNPIIGIISLGAFNDFKERGFVARTVRRLWCRSMDYLWQVNAAVSNTLIYRALTACHVYRHGLGARRDSYHGTGEGGYMDMENLRPPLL